MPRAKQITFPMPIGRLGVENLWNAPDFALLVLLAKIVSKVNLKT